jgi:hypothetical protein
MVRRGGVGMSGDEEVTRAVEGKAWQQYKHTRQMSKFRVKLKSIRCSSGL